MRKYAKGMVFVAVLCGAWSIARIAPALGPVDGHDLAPTDLERVVVGSAAPDFSLADEQGTTVTLSQFRDKNNVVLVFYRGHW